MGRLCSVHEGLPSRYPILGVVYVSSLRVSRIHRRVGGATMNTGQIKRIGKRTYCVIGWSDYDVTLQSMDEEKLIVVMPRKHMGGLRKGT